MREPTEVQQTRRDEGPTTERGAQRKRALLAAARTVFERKGFIDTTVKDIAAQARVAHGTFYIYFDTKEAVLTEVAYAVAEDILAALSVAVVSDDLPDRVRAAVRRYVEAYRPNARIIGLIEQLATFSVDLRKLRLDIRTAFVERTQRGIESMQAKGTADPHLDVEYTAEALGTMLEYTCYLWFSLERNFDEDRLIDALSAIWEKTVADPCS